MELPGIFILQAEARQRAAVRGSFAEIPAGETGGKSYGPHAILGTQSGTLGQRTLPQAEGDPQILPHIGPLLKYLLLLAQPSTDLFTQQIRRKLSSENIPQ